jgi:hypothetical protein
VVGAGRGVACALGAALLGSCCAAPPPARQYFDRQVPFDSVNAFAYGVEAGDYRFAYETLTDRSQELIPFTKFKLALRFGIKVPGTKVSLKDLIVKAERRRYWQRQLDRTHALVWVEYPVPGGVEKRDIYLEREKESLAEAQGRDPIWRIDLEQSFPMEETVR